MSTSVHVHLSADRWVPFSDVIDVRFYKNVNAFYNFYDFFDGFLWQFFYVFGDSF